MSEISELDGNLIGPYRRPVNPGQGAPGSIHNDAVAKQLGFRGGTIAGSIHMEQFPPLLEHAFGARWWQTGSLSLYFLNATLHQEPVRCGMRLPDAGNDVQVPVWMDHENDTRVCEGTASVGSPDAATALRQRLSNLRAPGETRILQGLEPGMPMGPLPARIRPEDQAERLAVITEPLDAYKADTGWGRPILTPNMAVRALRRPESTLALPNARGSVGLFGAIELCNLAGPAFVDREYLATGEVLAVGETPKSEYYWYESQLHDPQGGEAVMSMIMMLRFMKRSSELWAA